MTTELLSVADQVLRSPHTLLSDDPEQLARYGPPLALLTAAGAGVFGFTVGSWHGGPQMLYSAVKAPLLFIVPLAVCLPALRALFDPWGTHLSPPRVALAGLVGMARAGLMSAAIAPVLWLVLGLNLWYPYAVLMVAGTLGLAGLPGLATIAVALRPKRHSWAAVILAISLLGATTAQTGWMLRPFIGRPGEVVTFLRPVENDVVHGLWSSLLAPTLDYSDTQ